MAVTGVVAYCLVWRPFQGDQALMALVGRDVFDGRHLYTEIFDAKQPGMYLWYGTIDYLFGPGQAIAQLGSVLLVLLTAVLMVRLLAPGLQVGWVRSWAPILVAAPLLLQLNEFHLGQSELLVWAPGIAALLLVAGPAGGSPSLHRSALAGTCVGAVVMVKAVLVVVPGLAVLAYLLMAVGRGQRVRHLAATAAGALLVPLAVVLWLALSGDLSAALYAWFGYPGEVLELRGVRSVDVLLAGVGRLVLLLAGVGLLALWRIPTVLRRRDPLDVALLVWVVLGVVTYLIQVWWDYYLIILIPGLLGLAVRQLDELAGRPRLPRAKLAVVAVLTVPMVVYGLFNAGRAVLDGAGITEASRDRIAARIGDYDVIRGELASARLAEGDSLYVLGDTRYQLLSGRPIPVTTNGRSAGFMPPRRWEQLADELRTVRPTVVFVDATSDSAVRERGSAVRAVLVQDYRMTRQSAAGSWWRHTDAGQVS